MNWVLRMLVSFPSNSERYTLHICSTDSLARQEAERFIANRFADKLEAKITSFMPTLLVVRNKQHSIVAACGVRPGTEQRLFLETYLDEPIERTIGELTKQHSSCIARQDIVEIGNLASSSFSASRFLFKALFDYCNEQRFIWVAFTSCQRLITAFKHLGLSLVELADARESCVSEPVGSWGSYYQDAPVVLAGRLQTAQTVFAPEPTAIEAPIEGAMYA